MIRAVLFDLDGTLYDRDLLVGRIAREQFACFKTELAGLDEGQFTLARERCEVDASEAVFVGDHPQADVAGARAAGLIAVWKRVPYWQMPFQDVLVVDHLSEILPLCLTR
jgi:FMN phosphatase YigB (HAD superfamily)